MWDHPESRIAYLESVMSGANWRACIYAPTHDENADATLGNLEKSLQERGYRTKLSQDEHGNHALHIHHFNDHPSFREALDDMGFAKGISYGVTHPGEAMSNLYAAAKDGVNYTTANTARLLAGLYLLGDIALAPTNWFDKNKEAVTSQNKIPKRLASLYSPLAALQSVIYMTYAKDGHEKQQQELNETFAEGMQSGYKHLDISQWHSSKNEKAFEPDSMVGKVQNLMKSHPIEAGAIAQVVAGYSVAGANLLSFRNIKNLQKMGTHTKEALADLDKQANSKLTYAAFGGLTGTSWAILPTTNKEKGEEKTSVFHNITDNPAKISATFSTAGTLFGLKSAMSDGNRAKYAGQGIYLLGDATMFLLKSNEYGKKGASRESLMSDAASTFIHNSPMIFGKEEQQEFTHHLARYMVQQLDDIEKSEMPEMIQKVTEGINAALAEMPDKTDAFISRIATITQAFPAEKQEHVIHNLTETIHELPGIFISKQALQQGITDKIEHLPQHHASKTTPSMHDLAPHITKLLSHLPPMQAANNANAIYEALAPHMKTTAHDETIFVKNMEERSVEATGIPAHIIKSQLQPESLQNRNM